MAKTFTIEEVIEADAEGCGLCAACGERVDRVEPDARNYQCDACGEYEVYGAAEVALMGMVQ